MDIACSQFKNRIYHCVIALTLILCTVNLGGCVGAGAGVAQTITSRTLDWMLEPDPTVLELQFDASIDLNRDLDGRPSPLVVRFYELRSIDVFKNAEFFGLYDNDISILGSDINYREEIKFKPGEHRELTRQAEPESRFLAVFAAFRDLENAHWRETKAFPLNATSQFSVRLKDSAIIIDVIVDE